MPGAYAHITLVNQLRQPQYLDDIPDFPPQAKVALMRFFKFCELGAVSPDYPYLAVMAAGASKWADLMHYEQTGMMIQAGIRRIADMPDGLERRKALSWLLGYAAHVVTDVTIHPIVELKVGPYAQNQHAHRVCELHQDAYIFQRMNVGPIGMAEYLDSGIWACCDPQGSGRLDPVIASLWKSMLKECHPGTYETDEPDPEAWHRSFQSVVDMIEEGGRLVPAARHLAVGCGLTYPNPEEVDPQYVRNIQVPGSLGPLHYDAVFDQAIDNVKSVWSAISRGVFFGNRDYVAMLGAWNLDTGCDENNRYVYWS